MEREISFQEPGGIGLCPEAPVKPKITEVERRDPEVCQKIEEYLNNVDEKGIAKPINSAQLTRFFPVLKLKFIKWIEFDKRYISPERGRDQRHPVFTPQEIVLMLYVYNNHRTINLNRAMVYELGRLIEEAIEKREEEKRKVAGGYENNRPNGSK